MAGIGNLSDYRYGMDLASVEFPRLREQLLLDPFESPAKCRIFRDALNEVAIDGGNTEYILKALLDNDFYSNLSRLAQILKPNDWRPAYIKSSDIELIKAFENSVRLLREHYGIKEA